MNRFAYIIGLCILGVLLGTFAWAKPSVTPISEMNLEFTPCAIQPDPDSGFLPMSMSAIPETVVLNCSDKTGNSLSADLMRLDNGSFVKTASYLPIDLSNEAIINDGFSYTLLALSETEAIIERWINHDPSDISLKGNQYFIYSNITGGTRDITPNNLEVVAGDTLGYSADLYSVLYSSDIGFIFLVPKKNDTFELWQGKDALIKVQELPNVAFTGRAYSREGLTTVIATKSGTVYEYSYLQQRLVPSSEFSLLANQAVRSGALRPYTGAFTTDFVIWQDKQALALTDESGHTARIEMQKPPMDKEYHPILKGVTLLPTDISYSQAFFPFDEKRVVIEDPGYMRCVIVSPKGYKD